MSMGLADAAGQGRQVKKDEYGGGREQSGGIEPHVATRDKSGRRIRTGTEQKRSAQLAKATQIGEKEAEIVSAG